MRCDGCGAAVFEGDAACSDCGRELPDRPRRAEPAVVAPAVEAPIAEPEAPPADAPLGDAPRCAEHFDQLAPATCGRCGRYCCQRCLPQPRVEPHCPGCQRTLRLQQNPVQLAALRRELTVSFFFAALVIAGLGLAFPALLGSQRVEWYGLGTLFLLGQVSAAAGFLVLPRPGFAWAAVAVELVAALSLMAGVSVSLVTLVLLAFPLFTVFRIFRWQSLATEAGALAGASVPPG